MKPDWKDAPWWATHLALDEDGYWYWHECRPNFSRGDSKSEGAKYLSSGRVLFADFVGSKKLLFKRPEE